MIANCPITHQDVTNVHKVCGPDLLGIRGKTTRTKPTPVKTDYVAIPWHFLSRSKAVCLTANVMHVNGTPFLVIASWGIKFTTIRHFPTQTITQMKQSLVQIMQLYNRAGFSVLTILVDGQFEPLKRQLFNVVVNTTASSKHVGDIKQYIRGVKERFHAIMSGLPYQQFPKPILIDLLAFVVMWLNAFPSKSGASRVLSNRDIVIWRKQDFSKHCKAQFGSYCKVFDDPNPINTMTPRTWLAICFGPTWNLQGTYKFFAITTVKIIKQSQFKKLLMPESMVKAI